LLIGIGNAWWIDACYFEWILFGELYFVVVAQVVAEKGIVFPFDDCFYKEN
jgi:hypothetical protein